MGRSLPITEARARIMKLADAVAHVNDPEVVTITKRGRPVMAVLPYEAYETLMETLAILGDRELTEALRRSMEDVGAGRVQDLEDIFAELG